MFYDNNTMIVMDTNERYKLGNRPSVSLKHDDLLKLKDAGVKCVTEYFTWHTQEPRFGEMHWEECDELVSRVTGAGLKCILCGWNVPLQCAPTEWYSRIQNGGPVKEVLSYWNEDAQAYARAFYQKVVDRYKSDSCMVAMCEYLCGECCLHNQPSFYDVAALASHKSLYGRSPDINTSQTQEWLANAVVKHYVDTQEVLISQHNEIVEDLQLAIAWQSKSNGNFAQPQIIDACRTKWPDANYVLIQYTYFMHGEQYFQYIRDLKAKGITLVVEAQYCDGLVHGSTSWAIQHDAQGQIVAPMHPFTELVKLDQWMIDAIASASKQWHAFA